jgi:signal transduction histidine kinase
MHRSIFLRQVMMLLLLAIFLTVSLTSLFFGIISREIMTRIKVQELQPKAEAIADLAYGRFLSSDPYFDGLMRSALQLFDSYIFVVDGMTGEVRHTALPDSTRLDETDIQTRIIAQSKPLLDGSASSLWFSERFMKTNESLLYIGVPISSHFGGVETVVGVVFFVKPMQELNASLRSMYVALMLSAMAVAILMLLPAYLGTVRLIRPLKQTRDVAIAIAGGDFSLRADASQKGEIGELANTMNNLAADLSTSISALTLERNRLKQVLDGISEGIVAVDTNGRITQINQPMINLSRFDQQLDGQAAEQISRQQPRPAPETPDDLHIAEGLTDLFCSVVSENTPRQHMLPLDGRLIAVTVTPLEDDRDQIAGAVGLFRDVTESERLEQTRKDYVANVSHELRTPLTAMRALIEPLKDGMVQKDVDRNRYYEILMRETLRLSRLIDDMLELSRLQGGKIAFAPLPFNMDQIMHDLYIQYQQRTIQLGIVFSINETHLIDCPIVNADPDRIEQVLVILLDNAFKFTNRGGQVNLDCDWDKEQVWIHVQDTGCGIASHDIDHVFDRFYKADQAHHLPGTGLGLSIAKEILTLSGEKISVRSTLGQGTVFTFTLRRAQAEK